MKTTLAPPYDLAPRIVKASVSELKLIWAIIMQLSYLDVGLVLIILYLNLPNWCCADIIILKENKSACHFHQYNPDVEISLLEVLLGVLDDDL